MRDRTKFGAETTASEVAAGILASTGNQHVAVQDPPVVFEDIHFDRA